MSLQWYHCARNNTSTVTKQKPSDSCKGSQKVNITKNTQNIQNVTMSIVKVYNMAEYGRKQGKKKGKQVEKRIKLYLLLMKVFMDW